MEASPLSYRDEPMDFSHSVPSFFRNRDQSPSLLSAPIPLYLDSDSEPDSETGNLLTHSDNPNEPLLTLESYLLPASTTFTATTSFNQEARRAVLNTRSLGFNTNETSPKTSRSFGVRITQPNAKLNFNIWLPSSASSEKSNLSIDRQTSSSRSSLSANFSSPVTSRNSMAARGSSLYRSVLNSNSQNVINGSTPNGGSGGTRHSGSYNMAADSPSESPVLRRKAIMMEFSPLANLSPVSSLAHNFNSASLMEVGRGSPYSGDQENDSRGGITPCRRLSLSSNTSSIAPPSSSSSFLDENTSRGGGVTRPSQLPLSALSSRSYPPERRKKAPRRLTQHLSCSLSDSIEATAKDFLGDFNPLPSPSPSSEDKENGGCPPGTPKDKNFGGSVSALYSGRRRSPLKDIGNVSRRSLCFASPPKKAVTPSKKARLPLDPSRETSPPDEPDANSRDSGYSESATKSDEARLRESVACAPRKLNLDTPTKVKLGRLSSLNPVANKCSSGSQQHVTILPSTLIPSTSTTTTSIISPDSLLSQSSNFLPSSVSSINSSDISSCSLSSSSVPSSSSSHLYLASLLTQTNTVQDSDEDFYMRELYSLDEGDEENSNPSPVPKLGALLSGPVMDSSMNSSCLNLSSSSNEEHNTSGTALARDASTSDASPAVVPKDVASATKRLLFEGDNNQAINRANRASTVGAASSMAKRSLMERQDTVIIPRSNTVANTDNTNTAGASSSEMEAPVPIRASPSTPQSPSTYNPRSVGGLLACNMDVSPCNPSSRPLIRRTLSLFDTTPPAPRKSLLSPNYAFKRPLPPAEVSPFLDTKRHKAVAIGGTPQLPGGRFNSTSSIDPLPMLPLSLTPSPTNSQFLSLTLASLPPKGEETSLPQHNDGSPELPLARPPSESGLLARRSSQQLGSSPTTASADGDTHLTKVQSFYHLGARQYSAPVTAAMPTPFNRANMLSVNSPGSPGEREPLSRALSESHLSIMKALTKSQHIEDELTGDFDRSLCLPVITSSRHPDIKTITPQTMAHLITGDFSDVVESYQILDCRYPYEFNGGHIRGAESWHNPQFVVDHVEKASASCTTIPRDPSKRHILIFHCEFSAERGPKAQRLLRERDRMANKDRYPFLHYPETYLLEGGYKAFFEQFPELCDPQKYTKMMDAEHTENLKLFRSKSKSWATENRHAKGRTGLRGKKCNRD